MVNAETKLAIFPFLSQGQTSIRESVPSSSSKRYLIKICNDKGCEMGTKSSVGPRIY